LLPDLIGIKWLEHKNYIEKRIENFEEWTKEEEIREILRG